MTHAYEARLDDNPSQRKGWLGSPITTTQTPIYTPSHSNQTQNTNPTQKNITLPPLLPSPTSSLLVRHIRPAEICDHHAKVLCFKCDEKWFPSHRCYSKALFLLGVEENEPALESEYHPPNDVSSDISSFHALLSQLQGCYLCVAWMYKQHTFSKPIDSGSTDNFIKPVLAKTLGLRVTPCSRFWVATGCGSFLVYPVCCKDTPLFFQGITVLVDLFMLPIEGHDIVLGFPCLQSLGKVAHIYSSLTMEFNWNGVPVTLVGDPSLTTHSVSRHQLQALIQRADIVGLFTLSTTHTDPYYLLSLPLEFPHTFLHLY